MLHVVSLLVTFSGKIKELLSAELDIPVSKMELHGWIHKNDALIQDTVSEYNIGVLHMLWCFILWLMVTRRTDCLGMQVMNDFSMPEGVLVVVKDILRDLHLPKENTLFLLTPTLTLKQQQQATSDG